MLLYRHTQTQFPPELLNGVSFPDNLIFCFCPVNDYTNRDWEHPDNKRSYEDLTKWCKLSKNVLVWNYYAFYGEIVFFPYINTHIIAKNMRMAKTAGAYGYFFEFEERNRANSTGLSELLAFVYFRLLKDVNLSVDALIAEFCDEIYGPASTLMQKYHNEVEFAATTNNKYGIRLSCREFNKGLAYLTPERLYRWSKMFDEMAKLVKETKYEKSVWRVRRTVDWAVVARWLAVKKKHPEYFKDHSIFLKRAGKPQSIMKRCGGYSIIKESLMKIKYENKENPLPANLAKLIKGKTFSRLAPRYSGNSAFISKPVLDDSDAAFGYGIVVHKPDLPFNFGFYQRDNKRHGAKIKVEECDMASGKYQWFHLGIIQPSKESYIWFSAKSWATQLDTGVLYDYKNTDAKWDTWVSLKFPKNYTGRCDDRLRHDKNTDIVVCDQILLVKK